MHRSVATAVCGRRSKYLVVLFWIVMVVILGSLAAKLADVENNEASSWLPDDAESTRAIEEQTAFMSPDTIPAVVVYEREGGLTPADLEKAQAAAMAFRPLPLKAEANVVDEPEGDWGASQPAGVRSDTQLVQKAQALLAASGFDAGPPDGKAGPKTRAAVALFQRAAGLPVTGEVDRRLVAALQARSI